MAWFIVGFLVLGTAGTIVAGISSSSSNPSTSSSGFVTTMVPSVTAADWSRGNENAKVSLVEYGDFQCPACGAYEPVIEQLFANYSSTVQFVFRNFPLYQVHQDAGIAAQAAEAAGLQGKYWPMHDLLYSKQSDWSVADPSIVVKQYFDGYAQSLGLNVGKFDTDINSAVVTNKIQADVATGNAGQIDHTPTFFINLKQIPNPQGYDDFKATIDKALSGS